MMSQPDTALRLQEGTRQVEEGGEVGVEEGVDEEGGVGGSGSGG